MMRRYFMRFAGAILGMILVAWLGLYLFQDQLIFQSARLEKPDPYAFDVPFQEYFIPVASGDTLNALWFKPTGESHGLVLYFHGNRGNLQRWGRYAPDITRHGYEVLMIDYRGYGKSTGQPQEQALYDDARTVLTWAKTQSSFTRLILYGRSLGSAVASHLAAEVEPDLLILETPFDELRGVIRPYWKPLIELLPLRYVFSNADHLARVKSRVIIFHGTRDAIVPLSSALRLRPLLRSPGDFIIIPEGSHRNLGTFPQYQDRLKELLAP